MCIVIFSLEGCTFFQYFTHLAFFHHCCVLTHRILSHIFYPYAEDPQVRFAKSLGFYEDAEWTLNRASLGNKDDLVMNRRRSFEEGYGSFSDYQDDSPQVVVDEIDMARKKSPNTSPYGKTPPLPPS